MNADELRKTPCAETDYWLREIAAQLSELNSNLYGLSERFHTVTCGDSQYGNGFVRTGGGQ